MYNHVRGLSIMHSSNCCTLSVRHCSTVHRNEDIRWRTENHGGAV